MEFYPSYYGKGFVCATDKSQFPVTVPEWRSGGNIYLPKTFLSQMDTSAKFSTLAECQAECDRRNRQTEDSL